MTCRERWVLLNLSHPYLNDIKSSDNAMLEFMSKFIIRTRSICHQTPMKLSEFLEPPSTVWPSGNHLLGGNWRRIYLNIEKNCIYFNFNLSIFNKNGRRRLWGGVYNQRGALSEIRFFLTSVYL